MICVVVSTPTGLLELTCMNILNCAKISRKHYLLISFLSDQKEMPMDPRCFIAKIRCLYNV
jgi:hypothetical protein